MIKYEYLVLKSFTISREGMGVKLFTKFASDQKGSFFRVKSSYVDYEFPHRNMLQCDITLELEKRGYILLTKCTQDSPE